MARARSDPEAVTPSTRPPAVSNPLSPALVPAWNTAAPQSSIPVIGSPVRGLSGYPAADKTTQTEGSRFQLNAAPDNPPVAEASKASANDESRRCISG